MKERLRGAFFFFCISFVVESKRVQDPVVVAGSGLDRRSIGTRRLYGRSLFLYSLYGSLFNFELLIGPSTPFVTSFREGWL